MGLLSDLQSTPSGSHFVLHRHIMNDRQKNALSEVNLSV